MGLPPINGKLKVLCVEASGGLHSRLVAGCLARAPGVESHFLIFDPQLEPPYMFPPVRFSRHAASCRHRPWPQDPESGVQAMEREIRRTGCQVLLPIDEQAIMLASRHGERLSDLCRLMPLPDPLTMEMVIDKYRLAEYLAGHGVPPPSYLGTRRREDWEGRLEGLRYPVLIKPTLISGSGGGRGIQRFDGAGELAGYLERNSGALAACLAQELISGSDIVFAALCRNGRLLAYSIHRPYIPRSHSYLYARSVEFVHNERLLLAASRLLRQLKWTGPANLDFRIDSRDGRPLPLEFNARFWGTLEPALAAGINYPYLACLAALGREFALPPYRLIRYVNLWDGLGQAWRMARGRDHVRFAWRDVRPGHLFSDPKPTLMMHHLNLAHSLAGRLSGKEQRSEGDPPPTEDSAPCGR